MAATPEKNAFDRIDELSAKLGTLQLQIISLLTRSNQEHQAIDAKYAPELNPLFREAQDTFDELQNIATTHRAELLKGDKKSSRRNTGTIGWRTVPRLVLHVTEDELIGRLKEASQTVYRRLVRRTMKHELNRDAFLTLANKDIVAGLDGVEINREDDFYAHPSAGVRMSTAYKLWPNLEGKAGPQALNAILSEPDA